MKLKPKTNAKWSGLGSLARLVAALMLALPGLAQAQFSYKTNNGTIAITGYTGPAGVVNIPSEIDGLPVTTIESGAFAGTSESPNTNLTSVTIPDSVLTLCSDGPYSESYFGPFEFCISMTNAVIGASVTKIGRKAFAYSSNLTSVTIPTSVMYVGPGAFTGCSRLTSVSIPPRVHFHMGIDVGAFEGCSGLTNVFISEGVSDIGWYTFAGCINLTKVTIPNSLTCIGNFAFSRCSNLANVTIPKNVGGIGDQAFFGCQRLAAIAVDAANSSFSSLEGVLFTKDQTLLVTYPPAGKTADYTIPDGVTSIGEWAFYGCTGLSRVALPNTLTYVGRQAFSYCTNLTSLRTPNSVNVIDVAAFLGCISLTNITISSTLTYLGAGAFAGCTSLSSIAIPDSISSILGETFSDCISLAGLTIPNSVTNIGDYAFEGCTSLSSITIPDSVTSIGVKTFSGCTTLTEVTIPSNLTNIGWSAFSGCTKLALIEVDSANLSYTSIDDILFSKDRNLLITCPGGKQGGYNIPSGVTTIGELAFSGCTGLTSILIPGSVTNIGERAFLDCSGLSAFDVDPGSLSFCSADGVLFSKDRELLIACPNGKEGRYIIPNGVTSIGELAFSGCTGLTSIRIPATVTTIGVAAFSDCSSLAAIEVDSANEYYVSADGLLFGQGQVSLFACPGGRAGTYVMPECLEWIESCAFKGCAKLTTLMLPATVGGIFDEAFSYCSQLRRVFFQGNAPYIGGSLFGGANNAVVYHLPGTTGWGATLAERPTALWTSPFLATGGVPPDGNGFALTTCWAPNAELVVEASDVLSPSWAPVSTNTPSSGTWTFIDADWAEHPSRFYRVSSH